MPTALKVLQVIPSLNEGGAERTTIDIAEALIASGHQAFVATSGGRMIPWLNEMGAKVVLGPFGSKNPVNLYLNTLRLEELVKQYQISILHARSRAPAWSALFAARRTGCPLVTTHHGTFRDAGYFKSVYNSVMARGDVVIANSNFIADRIRDKYPAAHDKVITIPRGIDTSHFDPSDVDEARVATFKESTGAPRDARLVLLPGRLTGWKGQTVFIDAAANIAKQSTFRDVHFLVVGEGEPGSAFERSLIEQIDALGLRERFHFTGHWDDMPAAYAAASLVISASTEPEAFGRVAVEAQAMERPIIASALGGSLETIIPGETGWLCEPAAPSALAKQITETLNLDPETLTAIGRSGRQHVLATYSKDTMCAQTLKIYRSLAADNTGALALSAP